MRECVHWKTFTFLVHILQSNLYTVLPNARWRKHVWVFQRTTRQVANLSILIHLLQPKFHIERNSCKESYWNYPLPKLSNVFWCMDSNFPLIKKFKPIQVKLRTKIYWSLNGMKIWQPQSRHFGSAIARCLYFEQHRGRNTAWLRCRNRLSGQFHSSRLFFFLVNGESKTRET